MVQVDEKVESGGVLRVAVLVASCLLLTYRLGISDAGSEALVIDDFRVDGLGDVGLLVQIGIVPRYLLRHNYNEYFKLGGTQMWGLRVNSKIRNWEVTRGRGCWL